MSTYETLLARFGIAGLGLTKTSPTMMAVSAAAAVLDATRDDRAPLTYSAIGERVADAIVAFTDPDIAFVLTFDAESLDLTVAGATGMLMALTSEKLSLS